MQRRLSPVRNANPVADAVRPIRYLREYSNYLTPRTGFLSADTWTMIGIFTRNALLNQVILVSLFAGLLLLPRAIVKLAGVGRRYRRRLDRLAAHRAHWCADRPGDVDPDQEPAASRSAGQRRSQRTLHLGPHARRIRGAALRASGGDPVRRRAAVAPGCIAARPALPGHHHRPARRPGHRCRIQSGLAAAAGHGGRGVLGGLRRAPSGVRQGRALLDGRSGRAHQLVRVGRSSSAAWRLAPCRWRSSMCS